MITALASGNDTITLITEDGDKRIVVNVKVVDTSSNNGGSSGSIACSSNDPLDKEYNKCFIASSDLILNTYSITIQAGGEGRVSVTLPKECGTLVNYTRMSADGEGGWSNYVSQDRSNITNTGFTWIIRANANAKGREILVSQTVQYNSLSPSGKCTENVKSMVLLQVKIV